MRKSNWMRLAMACWGVKISAMSVMLWSSWHSHWNFMCNMNTSYIVYISAKCMLRLILSINRSSCCSSRGSNIWKISIGCIKAIIGYLYHWGLLHKQKTMLQLSGSPILPWPQQLFPVLLGLWQGGHSKAALLAPRVCRFLLTFSEDQQTSIKKWSESFNNSINWMTWGALMDNYGDHTCSWLQWRQSMTLLMLKHQSSLHAMAEPKVGFWTSSD